MYRAINSIVWSVTITMSWMQGEMFSVHSLADVARVRSARDDGREFTSEGVT